MTNNNLITDRELLELAAKAAGLNVRWNPSFCKGTGQWERDVRPVEPPLSEWLPWNPITDDGDALRLAVKLGFVINNRHVAVLVDDSHGTRTWQEHDGDEFAATRRAIVRAAAEIGRSMK